MFSLLASFLQATVSPLICLQFHWRLANGFKLKLSPMELLLYKKQEVGAMEMIIINGNYTHRFRPHFPTSIVVVRSNITQMLLHRFNGRQTGPHFFTLIIHQTQGHAQGTTISFPLPSLLLSDHLSLSPLTFHLLVVFTSYQCFPSLTLSRTVTSSR